LSNGLTRTLANFAVQSRFEALPGPVRAHTVNAFLNWLGCVYGGCSEDAISIGCKVVAEEGGPPRASVIGRKLRTDAANAAFLNCISSSIQAFDDAHLPTVTHPSGPAAAALFAISETRPIDGEEFINALALGIELQCRLSNALVLPPSKIKLGFYMTGLTAPMGVAAAVGRLLKLDEQRMIWALGIASSQSAGFRAVHGTMSAHFRPGYAARAGIFAAMLAANGFDCATNALEAPNGFFDTYATDADLRRATARLGEDFEILANAYKPYPCGIVIHPTIDACLDIRQQLGPTTRISTVTLRVNPAALTLTGKRSPQTTLESHVSIYHWAAVALLTGKAGLGETRMDCICDQRISALRSTINAVPEAGLGSGEAIVEVTCEAGEKVTSHIEHARGSIDHPMTDEDLDRKFMIQVGTVLPVEKAAQLLRVARNLATLSHAGEQVAAALGN
jgi:2-methylcitrate dehydratase PrpD